MKNLVLLALPFALAICWLSGTETNSSLDARQYSRSDACKCKLNPACRCYQEGEDCRCIEVRK